MRHSRIWPAFSTARRWRCNPPHTHEIPGPGNPRRGYRRPSPELGCREGKPVWNPSGTCLEEAAIWRSRSREPAGQSDGIRHLVPPLVATAGLRGFTLSQRIGLGCAGQVRYRLLPRSARGCKTIGGRLGPVGPRRILAGSITGQCGPRPRSSSAGRTGCLLRVSGTVFSFTICRRSCRRVSVLPGPVGGHLIGREPSGQAPRPGGMAQRKSRHGQFPPPEPAPLFAYPSLTSRPRAPRHRALALARIWSNRRRLSRRIQKRACRHRRRPTRRRPVRP